MFILKFRIVLLFFLLGLVFSLNTNAQNVSDQRIPGTIFLDEESYLRFEDILYIHGFIAPTSRLNRYKAFKILYNNSIRIISLYSLKFVRIDKYEVGIGLDGEPVIKNLMLRVETKNRLVLEIPYFELNWVLVKIRDSETNRLIERRILFNKNGRLNIQKIIFD